MIFKQYFNKDAPSAQFFAEKYNISPKIMEIILSRGITSQSEIEQYLSPTIVLDPNLLSGVSELKDRLLLAKQLNDGVVIFGDYDVDGVSATAIMLKTLKKLGIKANSYLPNRYVDGYGLTTGAIDKIIRKFNPSLIITVDCGISCYDEVEYAKEKGVEIIVTDHHELPATLPQTIVINAKLPGQSFGFDGLCGAGLAYKISEALLGEKGAEDLLPIAAIATIADIVPLQSENRRIVTKGLKLFEKHLPLGLKMLFKENKLSLSKPSANAISYKISPKLNASGRMGDAEDSLNLILETDPLKAKALIEKINSHNTRRQAICTKIYDEAVKALEKVDLKSLRVITLASKKWDQGVLGIVCSRLVEKYHRPVFLFSQEGDILKGSGRSIDDINIHRLLSCLQDILITYGGHSMAAGVSIKRENYEEFSKRVNSHMFENVSDEVFIPIRYFDQEITADEIDQKFLSDLQLLEPCGCANQTPKFKITSSQITVEPMKRFPEHAEISIENLKLLFFNCASQSKAMRFSRQKSFIFEFQDNDKKGIVCDFDGGSFIVPEANSFLFPVETKQLMFDKTTDARYNIYQKDSLLDFVTGIVGSVFGTAFVSFNGYEYVNFAKTYSNQDIYHFGMCDSHCMGYNSLLLAPEGVLWAKNFSKIVFLTPVLEEGYIAELNKISSAEIYVPFSSKQNVSRYNDLNLSRENFGRIFSIFASKQNQSFSDVYDIYESCFAPKGFKFLDVYVAMAVFEELQFFTKKANDRFEFTVQKNVKKNLTDSKIYNKLSLIKNMFREGK